MSDCELLLSQVLTHPEDDLLRLVYADALDERGGEGDRVHAQLIRVMIDLHREQPDFRLDWSLNSKVYDQSGDPRVRLVVDLVRAFYLATAEDRKLFSWSGLVWRRGFGDEFRGNVHHWAETGDSILLRHPVGRVTLTGDAYPLLSLNWTHDAPNRRQVRRAEWRCGGKERASYEQSYSDLEWVADWAGMRNLWQERVLGETVRVFSGWWKGVREWDLQLSL